MNYKKLVYILKILAIASFVILIFNRVLIFAFSSSIAGYKIERIIFWTFIISSLFVYKNSHHKKLIIFSLFFILISNFIRSFHTYIILTDNEKRIDKHLFLRESTTIETNSAFHIMERNFFIEKNITLWNSNLNYEKEFRKLKDIKSIELIKYDSLNIILKYENGSKIKIDTFQLQKKL